MRIEKNKKNAWKKEIYNPVNTTTSKKKKVQGVEFIIETGEMLFKLKNTEELYMSMPHTIDGQKSLPYVYQKLTSKKGDIAFKRLYYVKMNGNGNENAENRTGDS